jgi:hypothetical protein
MKKYQHEAPANGSNLPEIHSQETGKKPVLRRLSTGGTGSASVFGLTGNP